MMDFIHLFILQAVSCADIYNSNGISTAIESFLKKKKGIVP